MLLGHRGAREHAPENTLPALGLALGLGADGVEFDVHLAKDGVPVVVHDETLQRTMRAHGRVDARPAAELAGLEPAWGVRPGFAQRLPLTFHGGPKGVPALTDALDRMPDGAVVNVEIKGPTPRRLGVEPRVIDALRPHQARLRLVVSSFHPAQLLIVRQLEPMLPIGLLVEPEQNAVLRAGLAALALRPEAFHPPSRMVTPGLVEGAHRAGMRVHVWGVASAADARRLAALGVDALIVDDVPEAIAAVGRELSPARRAAASRGQGRARNGRNDGGGASPHPADSAAP